MKEIMKIRKADEDDREEEDQHWICGQNFHFIFENCRNRFCSFLIVITEKISLNTKEMMFPNEDMKNSENGIQFSLEKV